MTHSNQILSNLKSSGFRITTARRVIVELFSKSKVPLSAAEILADIQAANRTVNKTTVYRELEFLHEQKIIRQIDLLEGMKRYELMEEHGHHHHFVCTKCQKIKCIEMENDLAAIERRIERQHGIKVTSHTLEFFGICSKCDAK